MSVDGQQNARATFHRLSGATGEAAPASPRDASHHAVARHASSQSADRLISIVETTMDIELAAALAPEAHLAVYFAPATFHGKYHAFTKAIADRRNNPGVVSCSFGLLESEVTRGYARAVNFALQAGSLKGITFCAASGDDGSGPEAGRPSDRAVSGLGSLRARVRRHQRAARHAPRTGVARNYVRPRDGEQGRVRSHSLPTPVLGPRGADVLRPPRARRTRRRRESGCQRRLSHRRRRGAPMAMGSTRSAAAPLWSRPHRAAQRRARHAARVAEPLAVPQGLASCDSRCSDRQHGHLSRPARRLGSVHGLRHTKRRGALAAASSEQELGH